MHLDFIEHEFYFVCYPGGAGGIHLSNIISMDAQFNPRVYSNHTELENQLDNMYKSPNPWAHLPDDHYILGEDYRFRKCISKINHQQFKKSVHPGHSLCFKNSEIFKFIPKKKIIIITFKLDESINLITQRERDLIKADTCESLVDQQYAYSRSRFINEFNINDSDIFEVEVVRLFQKNLTDLINDLNRAFNINIPTSDQIQKFHMHWLEKNRKYQC